MEVYTSHNKDDPVVRDILDGLNEYNYSHVPQDGEHFIVALKHKGSVLGGAHCVSGFDWMHVKLLWVAEAHRHKGYGVELMQLVDKEARRRGCLGIHLDTFSFQAKDFYLKLGYKEFGVIHNHPKGHSRHYLQKVLAP